MLKGNGERGINVWKEGKRKEKKKMHKDGREKEKYIFSFLFFF